MAKLTPAIKAQILADFDCGISQNALARKYRVSPATINKLCKGKKPQMSDLVNAKVNTEIAVARELIDKTEAQVNAFNENVSKKVNKAALIHDATARAVIRTDELLQSSESVSDHAMAIAAYDKASLTLGVNPRHAPKAEIKAEANTAVVVNFIIKDLG